MQIFVPFLVLGMILLLIGMWGRRHADDLSVVPGMEPDRIDHREKVMRRGASACGLVGVAFLVVAVLSLLFPV